MKLPVRDIPPRLHLAPPVRVRRRHRLLEAGCWFVAGAAALYAGLLAESAVAFWAGVWTALSLGMAATVLGMEKR